VTRGRPARLAARLLLPSLCLWGAAALWSGCNLAPKYQRPPVQSPAAFKELPAPSPQRTNVWQVAQPSDALLRGNWWEMFTNAELSALETQIALSNQNVAAAFANYLTSRAIVKEARAQYFPTLNAVPDVSRQRTVSPVSSGRTNSGASTYTIFSLPLQASWQPDFWGLTRNTVRADSFEAQAAASDLQNARLAAQSELASDFFQLRSQDSLIQLYAETVKAYRDTLNLTRARFSTGIASQEDVSQAETQLETTEAQATSLAILRAQLEHAIAVLIGKAPAELSIPVEPLATHPPAPPLGLPSRLLERRPDIAAAERRVAEANARIGIAKAAYFPNVTLTAAGGFQSPSLSSLLNWSSRVWSAGASATENIFDAGLRRATVRQFRAAYEGTVAQYRQTVLTAFQQVEDNLASLRILTRQIRQQEAAVKASELYLALSLLRYTQGIDSYLNVISAQTTLLANRQTLVTIRSQQMVANVQLIQAVGGGWDDSQLPSQKQLATKSP
jgi:NodT family efflux transporter outer membrane factor (OMF) lipoprotein